ncbi:hypothetical protein F0562_034708 [Nyssa sinensis]|uniref:Leucine-rich repeat-containing N-terminal plant-type domain-containing protein n=1 Tax=Nyssa sinensis TaxID=561372 RepID=A0A5J5ADR3_9ASTE|nr:hypothetical protein F0562_034708 [Nyssa sinensis]
MVILVYPVNTHGLELRALKDLRIRVVALNLTTWLGNNNLSGSIPDISPLKHLEILHLEDNRLSGEIPPSLGNIDRLRELFLQYNNLTGQVPNNLIGKPGLTLRVSPGNQFLSPPPS